MKFLAYRHPLLALAVSALVLAACDDSPTEPDPVEDPVQELTVDAADDWTFIALGEEATEVTVSDRATSAGWDMGFFATGVMLNGGDAGPGDVEGACLCDNADLSDAAIMALTEEDGLEAFEAVTVADIPSDEEAWEGDAIVPAIDGWWTYNVSTHQVSANPDAVFKVRTAAGDAFAKLHVTAITDPTQGSAGTVTLEFATQPGAGEPFGSTVTLDVDVSGGPAAVDLDAGAQVSVGAEGWDLQLQGYDILVNGGVSGEGQVGALPVEEAFEDIADAGDLSDFLYRADAFGGVFASDDAGRRWYKYNLDGGHQIWPTFNVYVVRKGEAHYKVQIAGYYHPDTGDSRHITVRYERLES